MKDSWKYRWPRILALCLICLLVFQDNVITVLAETFLIQITLKDNDTAATLNKTGVTVSLTGVDDPTVSGNGVTSGGVAQITVSANEGDPFYVSVGEADGYYPVEKAPVITLQKNGQYEIVMQAPLPVEHVVTLQVSGEGTVKDKQGNPVSDRLSFYDTETAELVLEAAEHSHIAEVMIDGQPVGGPWDNSAKRFEISVGEERDHQVSVVFARDTFSVSASVSGGDNGSVRPDKAEPYVYGETCHISIRTEEGYNVEQLLRNGKDVSDLLTVPGEGDNNDYLVHFAVEEDTSIQVSFSPVGQTDWMGSGITFNADEAYATVSDGNAVCYFYRNDRKAVFSHGEELSIQGGKGRQSWEFADSTEIDRISVRNFLKWKRVELDKKIRIVIDRDAPVAEPIPQPDWTGEDSCSITGKVYDAAGGSFPASGIDCAVYSDTELSAADIAAGGGVKLAVSAEGEYTFTVSGEQRRLYYVWAVDRAGNISQPQKVLVRIDKSEPEISGFVVKDLNTTSFGSFFNEDMMTVQVRADDPEGSGVETITLYLDGKSYRTGTVDDAGTAEFRIPAELVVGDDLRICAEISAKARDKVGNVTGEFVILGGDNSNLRPETLLVEKNLPVISILSKEEASYIDTENRAFYTQPATFTINVGDIVGGSDRNAGLRAVSVTVNGIPLTEDNEHRRIDRTYWKETEKVLQDSFVIDMRQVPIPEDGRYEIRASVTDNAGNRREESFLACLDGTAPVIVGFDFQTEGYLEGDGEELSSRAGDYGFYFDRDTRVTIQARDQAYSSGIKSLTWYTVNAQGVRSHETTAEADADGCVSMTIPAEFKGQIYARATDHAGNTTETDVTPEGVVVESQEQHDQEEHILFSMGTEAGKDINGQPLYAQDVDVRLAITDSWSGIRSVSWSVKAPYNEEENQSGELEVTAEGVLQGDEGWNVVTKEGNLVLNLEKRIAVRNNSNAIVLAVTMTDRAGNVSSEEEIISIDKEDPTIQVTFDNMTPDSENTAFYNADRTATIVITERNFDPKNIKVTVANTDEWLPEIKLTDMGAWEENRNSAEPDKSTYTARIPFTEDGDFTMELSFADNGGRVAVSPEIEPFTIDKTLPSVRVGYDNNVDLNGNFYGQARTAEITITEHNFDPGRISIIGTCTDDGNEKTFPAESGWRSNGDEHTVTIAYNEDGRYTFAIEGMDMAGNAMEEYAPEEFYIDLTQPAVRISGVEDRAAYNGMVAPVVEVSDTNIDRDSIRITLTGVNNGEVEYAGTYEEITNGRRFTFDDFERISTVDDIYVLKVSARDLAGHEAEESTEVMFSVNRFGSVYTFDSPAREEILGRYITQERDIVLTETNVNELERSTILIKLMKNGIPTDLAEGQDYTITAREDEGLWCRYTYTIRQELFSEDGTYTISVYSEDKAGNVNENVADDKYFDPAGRVRAEISFGVDKTAPVAVPIDLENNTRYREEVKQAAVEVKDNLVLAEVKILLNGVSVDYTMEGEICRFSIPESTETQSVQILAYDAAGNEGETVITGLVVTTNAFALWLHNTPLLLGTVGGAACVIGGGTGAGIRLVRRRKRRSIVKK